MAGGILATVIMEAARSAGLIAGAGASAVGATAGASSDGGQRTPRLSPGLDEALRNAKKGEQRQKMLFSAGTPMAFGQSVLQGPKAVVQKTGKATGGILKMLGVVGSLAAMLKQSQLFTGFLGALFQIIGAFLDAILAPFMPYAFKFLAMMASQIPKVQAAAQAAHDFMIAKIFPFLNDYIWKPIKWIFNKIADVWNWLTDIPSHVVDWVKDVWDWLGQSTNWWSGPFHNFKGYFDDIQGAFDIVKTKITEAWDWLGGTFKTGWNTISDGWATVKGWIETVKDFIVDNVKKSWDKLFGEDGVIPKIGTAIGTVLTWVTGTIGSAAGWIFDTFKKAFFFYVDMYVFIFKKIWSLVILLKDLVLDHIVQPIVKMWHWLKDSVGEIVHSSLEWIRDFLDGLFKFTWLKQILATIVRNFGEMVMGLGNVTGLSKLRVPAQLILDAADLIYKKPEVTEAQAKAIILNPSLRASLLEDLHATAPTININISGVGGEFSATAAVEKRDAAFNQHVQTMENMNNNSSIWSQAAGAAVE